MTFVEDAFRAFYGELCLTDYPFAWEFGAEFGAGEVQYEELGGMFVDGEMVSSGRTSNRELTFAVWTDTPTLSQSAEAEALVLAEASKPMNTLTVFPGNDGDPFVFETFRAQVVYERSEESERAGARRMVFTVPARPFTRALDPVVSEVSLAPPAPVAPVVVTVDDGTSATSWAASHSGVVSSVSGAVRARWDMAPRDSTSFHLARNASVSMTGTRFLRIEWASWVRPDHDWYGRALTVNGRRYEAADIDYQERTADGRYVSWLDVGTGPITQIGLRGVLTRTGMTPSPGPIVVPPGELVIYDIKRADQIVTSGGTGQQMTFAFPVLGTAPTQASLHLWDQTDTNLGDVLLYTGPRNGMLSLEPFVKTPTIPRTGTVSGTSKDLSAAVVYDVPSTMFDPNRSTGYLLMARLNNAGSGRLDTTVQSIVGVYAGSPIVLGPKQVQGTPATAALDIVCLGAFTVPPMRVDGKDAGLRVTLFQYGATASPFVDDVWLVDIESGSLTWVNREGAAFGHLWYEPASVKTGLPRVRIGAGPNGAVGWEASPKSHGKHEFPPGEVHVTAVSTEAAVSKMQIEYFPRNHTHTSPL